jgi:UTP--glucose-1-phosphate uridylyltransferase
LTVNKAVITAAGIGTRLLPATKEIPKEMLPLFSVDHDGKLCLKPVLQLIFEQLYSVGFRGFCFVVGRGKRSVVDHFTSDYSFVELLRRRGRESRAKGLEDFYRGIEDSVILWVNQPEPRGFGHAVLMAEAFVGVEPFLVHAGDTYIASRQNSYLKRLLNYYADRRPEAVLVLREVREPGKLYGVAEVERVGGVIKVRRVVEKPREPPTNLAIMPVYIFNPVIMKALRETPPGVNDEIQLTDAVQKLIEWGLRVEAIMLNSDEERFDVGTPETYWEALAASYRNLNAAS